MSLREFVSMQIGYERQTVHQYIGFAAAIGIFGWSQIQHRLEILNHENARVAMVMSNTVSSDTYKSDENRRVDERDKLDKWRSDVDGKFTQSVTKEEVKADTTLNRRSGWSLQMQLVAVVVSILALSAILFTTYRAIKPDIPKTPAVVCTAAYHPSPCP